MANAEAITCVLGSASHFNLFSKPNTRIDIITRTDHQKHLSQCLINQMKQADYYFIDGTLNYLPSDRVFAPYLLGITDYWKEFVKQMWGVDLGDEKTAAEPYKKFAEEWTRFFCDNPRYFNILNFQDLDCYNILERMAHVLLGRKLDRSKYNVVSKKQLREERDNAKKQSGEERIQFEKQQHELKERTDKEINWLKDLTEKLQAEMQAARQTYSKNEERLATALKKSEREKTKLAGDYNALHNSLSFKVGRMITFFPRKVRNIFKKKR